MQIEEDKIKKIVIICLITSGLIAIISTFVIIYGFGTGPGNNNLDKIINDFFYDNRSLLLANIFYHLTNLGHLLAYIGFGLALYYLWDKKKAFRIIVTLFISTAVNAIVKYIFNEPRPPTEMWYKAEETSPGLPSGHTQMATTFWGLITNYITKSWFTTFAILLITLIAFSRIYLSIHWFSDVLAGLGIGLVILGIYLLLGEKVALHISQSSFLKKLLYSFLSFLILVIPLVLLIEEPLLRLEQLKLIALFATASLSYAVEGRLVDYNCKPDKKYKYLVRALIAAITFGIFYFGLSFLFTLIIESSPWEPGTKITLDLIRYSLLGPVIVLLGPWIITKLKM